MLDLKSFNQAMEGGMATTLSAVFSQFSHIFGICPCCGEPFSLSDVRPHLKERRPRSVFDEIGEEEERIDRAVERLGTQEVMLRAKAKEAGMKQAKKRLCEMDSVFSGARLDPQDVKVIFDPVEYIVFDGMKQGQLRRILLLSQPPTNSARERILTSIAQTIQKGNLAFKTLRVLAGGELKVK
jgi:predicted Holliday junction resolvase-like endonuclease